MRAIIIFALVVCVCAAVVQAADSQNIRLTVERQDGAAWQAVNAAMVFAPGDHVRFRISSSFSGYLYVMNYGTSGTYELLFPRSDTGSDNRILAAKDYIVPASQGWFAVRGPAGHDLIYWLVSPVELSERYRPLPPPPSQPVLPSSLHPRCDDSIFKARGDCVDDSAGVKPVQAGEALPKNLSGVATGASRELTFIQDKTGGKESVLLSSPQPLSGPVVYELRLAHR